MTTVDPGACYAGPGPLDVCTLTYLYNNVVATTWGGIRSLYSGYRMHEEGLIAISGQDNTIVWGKASHEPGEYLVFRAEGYESEFIQVGVASDTVFTDTATSVGKLYRYKVGSVDGEVLVDAGPPQSAGLKLVVEIVVDPGPDAVARAIAVRGDRLFVLSDDGSSSVVVRYDISDPQNPVETGRREMSEQAWHLGLSNDGSKLYLTTESDFMILNANGGSGLPFLGAIYGLAPVNPQDGFDRFFDLLVDWPMVYLSCGTRALKAIDVSNPSAPTVRGTYDIDGAGIDFITRALEQVDGDLYVSVYDDVTSEYRQERLSVTKTYQSSNWYATFTLLCRSDDPVCWGETDAIPISAAGQGKGLLALGYGLDNQLTAVRNTASPGVLTSIRDLARAPEPSLWWSPNDTLVNYQSADSDSRYVYAAAKGILGDEYNRVLFAYDPWSESPDPVFATGDIVGSNDGGWVRSQGRFVYVAVSDRTGGASKTTLRVYEKAHGCEADPENPVRIFPEGDALRAGEATVVSWAVGCPTQAVVELLEDGTAQNIVSESYPIADDVAYFTRWNAEGVSADLENHTYQVKVTATYEGGAVDSYYSPPFRIEVGGTHEVSPDGSKDFTTIQAAINSSASGDTVLVYAGDYNEHLALRSNVRVVGKPGARIMPTTSGAAVTANGLVHPPTLDGIEFRFAGGINETALDVDECGVVVKNCTFASLERAVEITNGYGTFSGCTFVGNNDPSVGGAVWINSAVTGQTTFTGCIFEGNTAGSYGGAVWISSEGTYVSSAPQIAFVGCTFRDNSAPAFATVRVGDNTRPSFENCVFADNQVAGSGAIVGGTGGATASFKNCTFADNSGSGAFDVMSVAPLAGAPAITVDACLFASNAGASAISSTHGSAYVVSNSDFYGNATGDAAWAAGGAGNFSANPNFCGAGNYAIGAASPCVAGVTVAQRVGALDIGCVPPAVIASVPDNLVVGCPAGDADSLVVGVNFDDAAVTRQIGASELRLKPPYGTRGIWSTTPIVASAPASPSTFETKLRHMAVSGTGIDTLTVTLNGHPLDQRPIVQRRGFDYSGDGLVNVIDYATFAADYPSPTKPFKARSDFNNDGKVDVQDFASYGAHHSHQKSFSGLGYVGSSQPESPAVVALRFEEEDPLLGHRRLRAVVSMENAGVFQATLITLKNDNPKFRFVEWHPNEAYAQSTMATDLSKDGQDVIMIGAMGSKIMESNWVELGYFDIEVVSDEPLDPKKGDFELITAEILAMDGAAQNVPKTNSRRDYSAPVYRNELRQNYPNPFNPTTTIAFSLERASQAEIKIFDVRGALVKTLVNDQRQKGNHRVTWTGDNNQGGYVASGVYFYRLTAGKFRATKKMVLLR